MNGADVANDHAGRIPLTVIGGFLGSGKTTLLNRMLQRGDGRRLAVLVNDFGALNIDAALVSSRGADLVALSNGCVCCQIGGDLTDALIRVIDAVPPPEAIVIEASGVSDPWRIAQAGLADPALALDGVVVMADASALRTLADDPLLADTIERQLAAADLLVLNHGDRVEPEAAATLRDWLDARWPDTPRFETRFGEVPAPLLGVAAERPRPRRPRPGHGAHSHGDDTDLHDDQPHADLFESRSWSLPGHHRADALRALLRAMPAGVMRLKGVVRTDAHGWAVLQFAGRHGSLRAWPVGTPAPSAEGSNRIVAIGLRGFLPADELEAALRASLDPRGDRA